MECHTGVPLKFVDFVDHAFSGDRPMVFDILALAPARIKIILLTFSTVVWNVALPTILYIATNPSL